MKFDGSSEAYLREFIIFCCLRGYSTFRLTKDGKIHPEPYDERIRQEFEECWMWALIRAKEKRGNTNV